MLVLLHALEAQLDPHVVVSICFVELKRRLLSACWHLSTEDVNSRRYWRAACNGGTKNVTKPLKLLNLLRLRLSRN